ncbi:MAG TPA: alpha/beta fold hydrolase [bacterium]|nr:alpha/beta fold hydrolase [bacterium]
MKKIGRISLLLFAVAQASAQPPCVGNWLGALKVSGMELRIVFKITAAADSALTAKIDSPDQGAKDIPMDAVVCRQDTITIRCAAIMGAYQGVLSSDGTAIQGVWKQAGMTLPLNLKKVAEAPSVRRPQNPQKPYPYLEEEVTFENRNAGIRLAGTLTKPKNGGPFTAVILISGSGAQDRDETVFNHKPFWVLADHLTRRGIAVLRFDDRGVGRSQGDFKTATTQDFCSDVLAAVEHLKSCKAIDPRRIGLLGHSEGGLVAPMAASADQSIAFIVLLAGPGVTGEKIVLAQLAALARQSGMDEKTIADNVALQQSLFDVLKRETNNELAGREIRERMLNALSEEEKKQVQEAALQAQIQTLVSPWYRWFLTYDPIPALKKLRCPVLALNGEKDLQVPAEQNLAEIEKALRLGGNQKYTVRTMGGLNHLFQTCQTGAVSEYGAIEETLSPQVLTLIADWIQAL